MNELKIYKKVDIDVQSWAVKKGLRPRKKDLQLGTLH